MKGEAKTHEFASLDLEGAVAFIAGLPDEASRLYVEVWEAGRWQFVYGDEKSHVVRNLGLVTRGRRFRLRVIDLTNTDGWGEEWLIPG